jgi:hypothetical protein
MEVRGTPAFLKLKSPDTTKLVVAVDKPIYKTNTVIGVDFRVGREATFRKAGEVVWVGYVRKYDWTCKIKVASHIEQTALHPSGEHRTDLATHSTSPLRTESMSG